LDKRTDWAMSR